MRPWRLLTAVLVALPVSATAQETPARRPVSPFSSVRFDQPPVDSEKQGGATDQAADDMKGRACPGCPKRNLGWPLADTLLLNVMYNGINLMSKDETAVIGPESWWANLKAGFEWDNNPWMVNQFGHPYQGSNYFTAGRANGLGFYESAAIAALGSSTWEFFFENNHASFNDLINTTIGGIALGEFFHRTAWLIRDPLGSGRKKREMFALMVDPIGGATRLLNGDADRIADKPPGMIPSSATFDLSGGVMWQGASLEQAENTALPFVDMTFEYGDARSGRSVVPFEAFTAVFSLGGGGSVTQSGIRARLVGRPIGPIFQLGIFQTYDFVMNHAYDFGGQGFEVEVGTARFSRNGTSVWVAGAAGVTLLGAVNTLLPAPDGAQVPRGAGADGSRQYDYGPGMRWSGIIQVRREERPVATIAYQAYHVSVVDGLRSNHVLQRLYAEGRVKIAGAFAIGAAGEFFFRKAYFWPAGNRTDESPQFRVFMAWRMQ